MDEASRSADYRVYVNLIICCSRHNTVVISSYRILSNGSLSRLFHLKLSEVGNTPFAPKRVFEGRKRNSLLSCDDGVEIH